jgi:hypothetical protein
MPPKKPAKKRVVNMDDLITVDRAGMFDLRAKLAANRCRHCLGPMFKNVTTILSCTSSCRVCNCTVVDAQQPDQEAVQASTAASLTDLLQQLRVQV